MKTILNIMESVIYNEAKLSYIKYGIGDEVMILFHGYGQDSAVFEKMATHLGDKYTFYAIDIFYHGESEWHSKEKLDHDFWLKLFLRFIEKNDLKTFSVFGYSLGAKFAMLTYAVMPSRIQQIYLVAPDGFTYSFWYNVMTKNELSLFVFKLILANWNLLKKIVGFVSKLKFISVPLYRFVCFNLESESKRDLLFKVWSTFRYIKLPISELAMLIRKRHTSLTVYIGKNDEIIKAKSIYQFLEKSKKYDLVELDANHSQILKLSIEDFKSKIKVFENI